MRSRKFVTRVGFSGLLCLLSAAPTASAPKGIFGTYRKAGAADTLKITSKPAGKIEVNLRLIYAAGHTCNLRENAVWENDHLVVQTEGVRATEQCRLELSFNNRQVQLKDEGLHCTKVYCGARGTLHDVILMKK